MSNTTTGQGGGQTFDPLCVIVPVAILCFVAIAVDVLVTAIITVMPFIAAAAVAWGVYLLYRFIANRAAKQERRGSKEPFFPEPPRRKPTRSQAPA